MKRHFSGPVIGYSDIKKLLMKCIQSSDRGPGSCYTGWTSCICKEYVLATDAKEIGRHVLCGLYRRRSGPSMIEYLFKNDVKYLLLDEVEKMSNSDQNVLLNVMETGILTSTKVRKTATKEMNLSVYATTNDIDVISKPFRSRFL